MKFVHLSVLGLLVVCGCHGRKAVVLKNPGPPSLEAGWASVSSPDGVVSIGIPPGWGKSMPGLVPGMGSGGEQGGSSDPQMDSMQKQLDQMNAKQDEAHEEKLAAQGILLTGYQQIRPVVGEEVTRFYVQKNPPGNQVSFEDAVEMHATKSGKPSDPLPVSLPIGSAKLVTIDHTLRDGGVVHERDYFVPAGTDLYEVIFITENDAGSIDQIREPVMATLRIK